jgi:hypothetical protein
MSSGDKARRRNTHNLAAICEPIVYKMWDPRLHTTLQASTACYTDRFAIIIIIYNYIITATGADKVSCFASFTFNGLPESSVGQYL